MLENQTKVRRDAGFKDINIVDYTYMPVEKINDLIGKAMVENFRDFTWRCFGTRWRGTRRCLWIS